MKAIIPILLIIIAGAVFFMYVDSAYDNVKELRVEEEKFDAALKRSKDLVALRDALLSKYNTLSTNNLERLMKLLPDNVDNVRLILDLDGIASKHGISLEQVTVSSISESTSGSGEIGPDTSVLGEVELSFSISAPYQVFRNFLSDVEDSLRIVDVTSIGFISTETDLNTYSISMKTYWLK